MIIDGIITTTIAATTTSNIIGVMIAGAMITGVTITGVTITGAAIIATTTTSIIGATTIPIERRALQVAAGWPRHRLFWLARAHLA